MWKAIPKVTDVGIESDVAIVMHEITHALGFSAGMYSLYIDPTTNAKLTNTVL